jgi:hypothetical protein
MKVTLNPVFDSLKGNMDGIVFYTCHGKVRARMYAVPRDPKTPAQRARRTAFASAVSAWKLLQWKKRITGRHMVKGRGFPATMPLYRRT